MDEFEGSYGYFSKKRHFFWDTLYLSNQRYNTKLFIILYILLSLLTMAEGQAFIQIFRNQQHLQMSKAYSSALFCVNVCVLCVGSIATIPRQSPLVRVMVTLVTAPDLTSVILNPQTVQYSTVHVTCALLLLIVNWQAKVYYCNLCKLMHIMHKTMDHADQNFIYIIN